MQQISAIQINSVIGWIVIYLITGARKIDDVTETISLTLIKIKATGHRGPEKYRSGRATRLLIFTEGGNPETVVEIN